MTESPENPGWYDDPDDPEQLQYFDGIVWSGRRVPKRAPVRAPEVPPSPSTGTAKGHPGEAPLTWRHEAGHPPASPSQTSHLTTRDGRPLAGFGLRLASGFIDLIVVSVLAGIVAGWAWWRWMADYWSYVFEQAQSGSTTALEDMSPETLIGFFDFRWMAVAMLLTTLVASAYHLVMLATRGQTLGKMATSTVVRRVGEDGPLGWSVAARRVGVVAALWLLSMAPVISWVAFPALVVGHLWAASDKRRQTLHDKIAGTEVVEK